MKKKSNFLLLILGIFLFSACDTDFSSPESYVVPKTEEKAGGVEAPLVSDESETKTPPEQKDASYDSENPSDESSVRMSTPASRRAGTLCM